MSRRQNEVPESVDQGRRNILRGVVGTTTLVVAGAVNVACGGGGDDDGREAPQAKGEKVNNGNSYTVENVQKGTVSYSSIQLGLPVGVTIDSAKISDRRLDGTVLLDRTARTALKVTPNRDVTDAVNIEIKGSDGKTYRLILQNGVQTIKEVVDTAPPQLLSGPEFIATAGKSPYDPDYLTIKFTFDTNIVNFNFAAINLTDPTKPGVSKVTVTGKEVTVVTGGYLGGTGAQYKLIGTPANSYGTGEVITIYEGPF